MLGSAYFSKSYIFRARTIISLVSSPYWGKFLLFWLVLFLSFNLFLFFFALCKRPMLNYYQCFIHFIVALFILIYFLLLFLLLFLLCLSEGAICFVLFCCLLLLEKRCTMKFINKSWKFMLLWRKHSCRILHHPPLSLYNYFPSILLFSYFPDSFYFYSRFTVHRSSFLVVLERLSVGDDCKPHK